MDQSVRLIQSYLFFNPIRPVLGTLTSKLLMSIHSLLMYASTGQRPIIVLMASGVSGMHLDDVGDEPLREAMKNILVGDIKPKDDVQVIDPPSSSSVS